MSINKLFSYRNLELAWRRLNTASNLQYKRFFRGLYYAYEIAVEGNLKDLQTRLRGGSYIPSPATRIYLPKPSGLQRPITLLSIEDQVVWQGVANIFAKDLARRRKAVELRSVFSNILGRPHNNIFHVKNWKFGYKHFQDKLRTYYNKGYRWVCYLDLAAFYDTISHDLLLKTLHPRGATQFKDTVLKWLKVWSARRAAFTHAHGIPQGPQASNVLAEFFLLPIDEEMASRTSFIYLRYVDDIRLLAKDEYQLRRAAVKLEVLLRDKGLIPQGKKHARKQASSLKEMLGSLPSIPIREDERQGKTWTIPKGVAINKLREALEGKPQRVSDKTRMRFVFFNAEPCWELTRYASKLLLHHPQHIDAIVSYLGRCSYSSTAIKACKKKLAKTPYEYVQGELWHVLARMMRPKEMKKLIPKAVSVAKNREAGLHAKWGALHFLCKAESEGLGRYSRLVQYQQSSLLQALLVPALPDASYSKNGVVSHLLRRSSYEPGIMLAEQLAKRNLTHNYFGRKSSQLPTQVQNVFRELGIIRGPRGKIDPVGEILSIRYNIQYWDGWRQLLDKDYAHALQILVGSDAVFSSGPSKWLGDQNSFNNALFLAILKQMQKRNMAGAAKFIDRRGRLVKYGHLLDRNQIFSKTYPTLAEGLRESNKRRNSLPGSHPYEETGRRTSWLSSNEQADMRNKLRSSYQEVVRVFSTVL